MRQTPLLPYVALALLVLAGQAAAQSSYRPSPLETREDAWRRQENERFEYRRDNPYSLAPGPSQRLGDPAIPPPTRYDNFDRPRWDQPQRR